MPPPKLWGAGVPFVEHLGIELVEMHGGGSVLQYEPKREHMNSLQIAHGGAVMSLLDVSMATAARSIDLETGVITIEMKTSFMQPCAGLLTAKGRLMHRTKSMAFCESSIYDAAGRLCAHGTGTFKYVRRPAGSPPDAPIPTD